MITVAAKKGHITQVIGSTFDVEFEGEHLPDIYNAVTIKAVNKGISLNLVGEGLNDALNPRLARRRGMVVT